jgi:hypothetical protein
MGAEAAAPGHGTIGPGARTDRRCELSRQYSRPGSYSRTGRLQRGGGRLRPPLAPWTVGPDIYGGPPAMADRCKCLMLREAPSGRRCRLKCPGGHWADIL